MKPAGENYFSYSVRVVLRISAVCLLVTSFLVVLTRGTALADCYDFDYGEGSCSYGPQSTSCQPGVDYCPDPYDLWNVVRTCPNGLCAGNGGFLVEIIGVCCCCGSTPNCETCGGCFAGETPISVKGSDGSLQSVPIASLKESDKVVSQSTQSGEMTESVVETLHKTTREGYYEVTVEMPDGTEKTIKVTGEHPLFVRDAGGEQKSFSTAVSKVVEKLRVSVEKVVDEAKGWFGL